MYLSIYTTIPKPIRIQRILPPESYSDFETIGPPYIESLNEITALLLIGASLILILLVLVLVLVFIVKIYYRQYKKRVSETLSKQELSTQKNNILTLLEPIIHNNKLFMMYVSGLICACLYLLFKGTFLRTNPSLDLNFIDLSIIILSFISILTLMLYMYRLITGNYSQSESNLTIKSIVLVFMYPSLVIIGILMI